MIAEQTWKEVPVNMPEFVESADSFVRMVRGDKDADHDEIMVYRSGSRFIASVRSCRRQWLQLLPSSIVATNGRLKTSDEAIEWAKSKADEIPARLAFAALEAAFVALSLVPDAQAALDAARAEEREACLHSIELALLSMGVGGWNVGGMWELRDALDAIRARSKGGA